MDYSGVFGFVFLIWFVGFAAVIWALVDVIRVPRGSMFRAGDRLIWGLVILFGNLIGVIVYITIGRPLPGEHQRPPEQPLPPPPPRF